MIVVQLPNGDQAQFPDGMSDADIEAVLQREFGPNSTAAYDAKAADAGAPVQGVPNPFADAQPVTPRQDRVQSSIVDPLMQGATFGWADELRGLAWGAGDALSGGDFGQGYERGVESARSSLEREREVNPWGSMAAEFAGAIPTGFGLGGQIVGRGASLGARALGGLATGAAQGAVYGAGAADDDNRLGGAAFGLATGGALGAAAPAVGALARRAITPAPASQTQQAAARMMAGEGVTLTAGQRTGNKGLQYLESELGRGAAENLMEQQAEEFTSAVLRRLGINANRATPEVVEGAYRQIGQQFDNLAQLTNTPFDNTLQTNLLGVAADYVDNAGAPAPVVENMVNRIAQLAGQNGGVLTGRAYQTMRSEIGRRAASANPETRIALRELQEALDDAVERNLSGQTLQAWRDARRSYQNYLVVEKAVTSAGEKAAAGLITPAQLRTAAVNQNRRAFAFGSSDYADLARAGVQTMTPLPQSGTAPRLAAQGLAALPTILGAAAGSPAGIPGAIAGGVAGAAIPRLAGAAMLSPAGRRLLSNQVAAGPQAGFVERAIRSTGPVIAGEVGERAPLRIVVQRDR